MLVRLRRFSSGLLWRLRPMTFGAAAILLGLAVACGSAGQPQETVLPGNDSQQVQQPQLPTRSQAAAGPATGSAATSETSAIAGAASQAGQSHESAATGEIITGATEARPAPTAVAVDSPPEPVAAATIGVTSTQEPIAPPTAARGPEPTAAPAPTSTDAPVPTDTPVPVVAEPLPEVGNKVGNRIPDITLELFGGDTVSTTGLVEQGKPTFLFFTATT